VRRCQSAMAAGGEGVHSGVGLEKGEYAHPPVVWVRVRKVLILNRLTGKLLPKERRKRATKREKGPVREDGWA
jgi:hypothetical protein